MADPAAKLDAACDLLRRLPPANLEENLARICELCPDVADDVLGAVDTPLFLITDPDANRPFVGSAFNRDGDYYRSPFSNAYFSREGAPMDGAEASDALLPPPALRTLEEHAQMMFDEYAFQYFGAAVCSVFAWETADSVEEGFAVAVLIHKTAAESADHDISGGFWDSIHVFNVSIADGEATYALTATVMLDLATSEETGLRVAGSISKQQTASHRLGSVRGRAPHEEHVMAMGRALEEVETHLRQQIEVIYFSKTGHVLSMLRRSHSAAEDAVVAELRAKMAGGMRRRVQDEAVAIGAARNANQ
jgi:capping protein beta